MGISATHGAMLQHASVGAPTAGAHVRVSISLSIRNVSMSMWLALGCQRPAADLCPDPHAMQEHAGYRSWPHGEHLTYRIAGRAAVGCTSWRTTHSQIATEGEVGRCKAREPRPEGAVWRLISFRITLRTAGFWG